MNSEEILIAAFAFKGEFPPGQRYDFRQDAAFMEYLRTRFPFVDDFLKLSAIEYAEDLAVAAITLKNQAPVIYLNPHRFTYIYGLTGEGVPAAIIYQTLACLLWHEALHVQLRHFRLPGGFGGDASGRWNLVQDMVIDNIIHSEYPGWRCWQATVDHFNKRIIEKGKQELLRALYVDQPAEGAIRVTALSDKDLMVYLLQLDEQKPQAPDFHVDEHGYGEKSDEPELNPPPPAPRPDEEPGDDLSDAIASKLEELARARNQANADKPFTGQHKGDLIAQKAAEGRRYNLISILNRHLRRLSQKQKTNSWKKVSRKQYGRRPGMIYKKQPGEVLLIIDTSGSMVPFIEKGLSSLLNDLYNAFSKVASMQGAAFSRFYEVEADARIKSVSEVTGLGQLAELSRKAMRGTGNTDYRPVLNWALGNWRDTGSRQKLPDLIFFVTDFDADLKWLEHSKYTPLQRRLIWLNTNKFAPFRNPARGEVYDVFPDDFGVSQPY
jgi:predicted metal-dependent peptidase